MSNSTESNEAPGPADVEVPSGSTGACGDAAPGDVDCEAALRDLYGYLDGEITEERREDIRVHVEECGPCLEAFDFEVELRQLVARTCQCEAPDALRDRVAQAIHDYGGGGGDEQAP